MLRTKHYSICTEQAYVDGLRRFILFHDKRRPRSLRENEVAQFLTHLAVTRRVSASTQHQTLNALVFLCRQVLDDPLGDIAKAVRAKRPERIPVVLKRAEFVRFFVAARYASCCVAT